MNKTLLSALLIGTCLGLVAQERPVAFTNAYIIPIEGTDLAKGTLLIKGGKIIALGSNVLIPADADIKDMKGQTIMPGIVDSHSHIGSGEGADGSAPIQPEIRISDSVNVENTSIRRAQAGGLTTVNVMPGSGHLLSGQTVYLKLRSGHTIDELAFEKTANGYVGGMKMANGTNSRRAVGNFPGTRAKSASLVREQFIKAQAYQAKIKAAGGDRSKLPARDLGMEALGEVLEGKRTVHHHTHRHDDIVTVLRLQKEFGFKVVLHHVSEAWAVADQIKAAGNDVIGASVIIVDSPGGKLETKEVRFSNGAALEKAGVLTGFHTDDPITDSRWFLRTGALAVRYGMSRTEALKAMTINNAKLLGLDQRVGSFVVGKDADLIVLSGDPFSVYSKVQETWVEGRRVYNRLDPADRKFATGGVGAAVDTVNHDDLLEDESEDL
ncbi:MAG: amidohydrolase family protein [Holophagaceae bacterium]